MVPTVDNPSAVGILLFMTALTYGTIFTAAYLLEVAFVGLTGIGLSIVPSLTALVAGVLLLMRK
jgi:hypothetical protein